MPILLGTFVFVAAIPDARLIYNIIFAAVLFSVVVQGGLVPLVARWCGERMEPVEPEALGEYVHHVVERSSLAPFARAGRDKLPNEVCREAWSARDRVRPTRSPQ